MKGKLSLAAILALTAGVAIASDKPQVDFDRNTGTGFKQLYTGKAAAGLDIPVPQMSEASKATVATPARAATKEWTVMVYINGKNNLADDAISDVNEMEAVGSSDNLNIVVELGHMPQNNGGYYGGGGGGYDGWDWGYGGYGTGIGVGPHPPFMPPMMGKDGNKAATTKSETWTGSRRMLVIKDADMSKISSPVLQNFDKVDMGDYKHLIEFAKWAKSNYPARKYALIVWNHGSGWKRRATFSKGISYDDETNNHITTPQLGEAMAAIGKVDVYGSDACLMQMVEVNYQIKDYASYIVGSEETEPANGYDYTKWLSRLAANPTASASELAKYAVQAYTESYTEKKQNITQSYVKAASMNGLASLMSAWADTAVAAKETALYASALSQVQKFSDDDNVDLNHYVKLLYEGTKNEALKAKSAELMTYLAKQTVVLNSYLGDKYKNAYGIAVYLPTGTMDGTYSSLAFASATHWVNFINAMKATN